MGYLDGKVIAVTGAGRGIGRCVALDAARAGARVVVNDYGVSMDGRWTAEEIADQIDEKVGQERLPILDRLDEMAKAAAEGKKPNR
jgi:NAD(P)-dependent dehydrogenase (short-subunit alcohol dehydrogenase family)